jgi:hypothetical protein
MSAVAGSPVPTADDEKQGAPHYAYLDLELATNKWAKRVGQGGFAEVFSGKIDGKNVRSQWMNRPDSESTVRRAGTGV